MSMVISASNYLNAAYQSKKPDSKENEITKDALPQVGKIKQSATSASLDQINLGEDGIAVAEVNRQQGTEQTDTRRQIAHMDTVEISAEGLAACDAIQEQKSAASETSAVEEYQAEDLSEYTASELKQMYYQGKITLREYEDETGETLE